MLTPAAKQFRRENEILFSESESESEYEDSDNETSEPEIEREEDVPVSLTFEKVENERKCTGRPSRLRGAHIDLPKSIPPKTIPLKLFRGFEGVIKIKF